MCHTHVYKYRHVYGHVYGHVYRHVHTHVYTHVCKHVYETKVGNLQLLDEDPDQLLQGFRRVRTHARARTHTRTHARTNARMCEICSNRVHIIWTRDIHVKICVWTGVLTCAWMHVKAFA